MKRNMVVQDQAAFQEVQAHIQDQDQAPIHVQEVIQVIHVQDHLIQDIQATTVMAAIVQASVADIEVLHSVGDHDVDSSEVNGGGGTTIDGWGIIHSHGHGEASIQEWAATAFTSPLI